MPRRASHVEGRDRHLDPKRVALSAKAIGTIGAARSQLLLGKASDTAMFTYGATSSLAALVITMPMDGESMPDLRDVMTNRTTPRSAA